MDENENLHAGHRARMVNKMMQSPESISDHEVIEILLFSVIPRKNTNEIAHKLLQIFGSIDKVFQATPQQLLAVDGIGKKSAEHIVLCGQLLRRVYVQTNGVERYNTYEKTRNNLINYFRNEGYEKILVVLLDKQFKALAKMEFSDNKRTKVGAELVDVANAFAVHKPAFVLFAHNHPSGNLVPSEDDNLTTKKLNVLCEMHGVTLLDHIIVAGDRVFSYYQNRVLEDIKKQTELNTVFGNIRR